MNMNLEPLCVYLISSGAGGDTLLFKYPTNSDLVGDSDSFCRQSETVRTSSFSSLEDFNLDRRRKSSNIKHGRVVGIDDRTLENLLAVKTSLCNNKFELKVNDVIFVGYPLLVLSSNSSRKHSTSMVSFHIVFALLSSADDSLISSYQELSRKLAVSLQFEQERCSYLSLQKDLIWKIKDDMDETPEGERECPFQIMLKNKDCTLALLLKTVYESLYVSGVVEVRVNDLVRVSFCLIEKIHNPTYQKFLVKKQQIESHISSLRPYHTFILTEDEENILKQLHDANPTVIRLIKVVNVTKNLPELANLVDLPLQHVFDLVAHLVYWGKAQIVYPLSESNIYIVSPTADFSLNSNYQKIFLNKFKNSLIEILSRFSLPTSIGELYDFLNFKTKQKIQMFDFIKMITWLLRHKFIIQLHTYVYVLPLCFSNDFCLSVEDYNKIDASTILTDFNRYPEVKKLLLKCPASKNPDDVKMFARIFQYLDGNHHLEEIMYSENLKRSIILTIMDKFRPILCVNEREDAAISYWTNSKSVTND